VAASTASSGGTASAACPTDDARRGALLAAQLTALVRPHLAGHEPTPADFPSGAALLAGSAAWLLLDAAPLTALGPALVWADRRGATEIHLVAGADVGVLARRASLFAPAPHVWALPAPGGALEPAVADPPAVAEVAPPAPELAELLVDADLEVVVEGGLVRGEVRGLEVARIVHGQSTAGVPLDEPLLEVGVGQADRELTEMLHGNLAPVEQLARVGEIVRDLRRPDVDRHPLNQLVPERWLRSTLIDDPARIGLRHLRAVPTAVPRANLRDRGIAAAVGEDPDGATVVVACSVGVDLDLVPAAADTRLSVAPDAPLLLVVPERDAHPVTVALAARLTRPAELVALAGDWRR
jgi:hypothetical protein